MPEKSIEDVVMTPAEASKVLMELVTMKLVTVKGVELALASVRKKAKQPTRKTPARTKGRKKVRAKAVDVDDSNFEMPSFKKSKGAVDFLTKALTSGSSFLFNSLDPEELASLIDAMGPHEAKAETVIIKQGDIGDYFYVVEKGTVEFEVDGASVGSCGSGATFGELALLYDFPRAATCIADCDCKLWKVEQKAFRFMLAKQQANATKSINGILEKVPFLNELEPQTLSKMIDALTTMYFKKGQVIFKKGEVGDTFYILQQGTANVHDIGFGDTKFDDVDVTSGAFFGERALLTGEPRAANVTATGDCSCLALSRESFEATLGPLQKLIDRAMTKRVLVSIPSFGPAFVDTLEVDRFLDLMIEKKYKKGEIIMEEGKPLKQPALQIIRSGKLSIVSGKGEINNIENGGHFGESTLQKKAGDNGEATITATEDAVCGVLTKKAIEGVIGSTIRLGQARSLINKREMGATIAYKDLKKLRILGMGTFGKVWLVVEKKSNKAYALKMMDKRQCLEYKQHEGVIREKNILANINHPFLLTMWGSYQDGDSLMMLLDLIQGGELFSVLHTDDKDGVSDADATFYGACVLEGLGHLHERNIAYRDLKPENALIDNKGYCIVVDYGFAKVITSKTFTLCGTPEYLAPEIILSKGHSKGVDYWAFGILIYEMLIGQSPFFSNDQMRLFKKIVQGKFTYPKSRPVSKAAESIIKKLLERHQSKRLGSLKGGHVDVQKHKWFDDIDLEKLLKRELKAPWVPKIKDALDSSNFDDYSSVEEDEAPTTKLDAKDQAWFKEFGEHV